MLSTVKLNPFAPQPGRWHKSWRSDSKTAAKRSPAPETTAAAISGVRAGVDSADSSGTQSENCGLSSVSIRKTRSWNTSNMSAMWNAYSTADHTPGAGLTDKLLRESWSWSSATQSSIEVRKATARASRGNSCTLAPHSAHSRSSTTVQSVLTAANHGRAVAAKYPVRRLRRWETRGHGESNVVMKLPGPLSALRHRNFAIFWSAATVSDIGTWMQMIAVGVLVAKITGKASATGLVSIIGFATSGLLAPLGGVLSDRFDRRKMLLGALASQALTTTVLALHLRSNPSVAFMTVLISMQGAAGAVANPAAQALIPAMVPRSELLKAISLLTVCWNSGRIFGSLLAAALASWLAPSAVVAINAASFVILFFGVASARGDFRVARPEGGLRTTSLLEEFGIGWHELWRSRGCRFALVAFFGIQMTIATWVGLIPIYAQNVLGNSPGLASRLTALQGFGSIIGATVAAGLVARFGRPRALFGGSIICVLGLLGYSRATSPHVAYPFAFMLGAGALVYFVLFGALMQREAPEFARARIMSIQQSVIGVSYGFAVVVAGLIGDRVGLRLVLCAEAVLFALCIAIAIGPFRSWLPVLAKGDAPSLRWQRILAKSD